MQPTSKIFERFLENVLFDLYFVVAMKFSTENIDNKKILFIMILYVWALIQI